MKKIAVLTLALMMAMIFPLAACGSKEELSGTWERYTLYAGEGIYHYQITFSGKSFTQYSSNRQEEYKGTYSLKGDIIEYVYSDGHTVAFSFSRTENTLTINGDTFYKKDDNTNN